MVDFNKKAVVVVAGLLVLTLSLSSCDTLKQKFIRKKKGGQEDQGFTPVLEPEEYVGPGMDPKQSYKENYDLIKAWYHDLWTAIEDRDTARYTNYIITQVTNHITQMKALVDEPTQADLVKLSAFLDYYKASLDLPRNTRNIGRIRSDLIGFDRFMRDHLRVDRIKGHFIKTVPAPAAAKTAS
jgi:hypothetical protein